MLISYASVSQHISIGLPYHLPVYQLKGLFSPTTKTINPQRGMMRFTSGQMLHSS
jgi:hypothetical protein